jgi:uncharacterized repeat protein (TIGR04138 family)
MEPAADLLGRIETISDASGRYRPAAFLFILRCLEHSRRRLRREGHVSGQELVASARELALTEFGPMAKTVLNDWGIMETEDFGRIVFLMVDAELLSKTEEDSLDDFRDGFDFETEFVRNYPW